MFGSFEEVVEQKLRISESEPASNKVMTLGEAVETFVKPGMHLHFGHCFARPCAAVREVARRFWGTDPQFTMSALGFTGDMASLFAGGVVKRAIATFFGDSYPMPSPNPIYQEAYRDGEVEFENWTILSFTLRLLAGALGIEYIPAMSLLGTTMAQENREDYFTVTMPDGGEIGFARALKPDIAFVHGWAADPAGNVVCALPYAEGAHCARAAKGGTIVTVERIVSSDFVRRYSHFVRVPSYLVKAVCHTPLGSHPAGMSSYGLESEVTGYEVDRDFLIDFRAKCKDETRRREWMDEWVLGCGDHDEYVKKLGHERTWRLFGRSSPDAWRSELADAVPGMNTGPEYNPIEMMVAAGSRVIARKSLENGYRTILAGVGVSNLAAWLAYYNLRSEDYDCFLMAEIGFYGYSPQPADPFIFNLSNVPHCLMLTDVVDVLGSLVGAPSNMCIGALGAGQVDRFGNINSTAVPEHKLFLVGSGGAADVAAGAREVVITIDHSPLRLVEDVPYVTCPGDKITAVITTKGILEKRDGELVVTGYYPAQGGRETALTAVREECGWDLKIADDAAEIAEPSHEELLGIRMFDPHSFFLGKKD